MSMTIKQAKSELMQIYGALSPDKQRAIDTLVKIEPCEDAISRQAVDNYIIKLLSGYLYDEERTRLEELSAYLWELPSVNPQEPKWIPVSERLPEEDGEYLLFGKIDEDEENYIFIGEYDTCGEQFGIWQEQFDRHTLGCLGSEFFEYASVLAWQPLPQPYRGRK